MEVRPMSGVDFAPIQELAAPFAEAVGKTRDEARAFVLEYAGVSRLRDMNALQVAQCAAYMRSVVDLARAGTGSGCSI